MAIKIIQNYVATSMGNRLLEIDNCEPKDIQIVINCNIVGLKTILLELLKHNPSP